MSDCARDNRAPLSADELDLAFALARGREAGLVKDAPREPTSIERRNKWRNRIILDPLAWVLVVTIILNVIAGQLYDASLIGCGFLIGLIVCFPGETGV